jgi:hypothetical protein
MTLLADLRPARRATYTEILRLPLVQRWLADRVARGLGWLRGDPLGHRWGVTRTLASGR